MRNVTKALLAMPISLLVAGCMSGSTPDSKAPSAADNQSRDEISRALPAFIKDIPADCFRLDVQVSRNGSYARAGLESLNGKLPPPRCIRYANNGFFILEKTTTWKVVYNGSVDPPCSLRIPRDVSPCLELAADSAAAPRGMIAAGPSDDFRGIVLISVGTGAVTRVPAPDGVISQVDLSADGERIAIGGTRGIWVFSRSRAAEARLVLAAPPSARFVPAWVSWSPNEEQLVFIRNDALFTVALNGEDLTKLHGGRVDAPDWSPSGTSIVFVRNPSPRTEVGLIQSIELADLTIRSIVRGRDPDVSPDGSKLAFAQRKGIYVMPLRGKPRLITPRGEHPEWSPDGRYLAFTRPVECSEAGCSGRVFLVRATGGRARAIGPPIFELGPLSWSR